MPKMKTHSGAKKRFEITRTGKIRRRQAFLNHILEKKSADRKRRLGKMTVVSDADAKNVRKMLGK
ncbi:MAG TPA: 50S ribosomal protein L35 [Acidimicrobiales bacterium]|jgi:large subunit ribosomal protein L35|nr:50S ribosomal protein L35 [Acidimicrobiales bacterium]